MKLPDTLTDEQHQAIVDCLREFAKRGRAIRLARENEQKTKTADALGSAAAVLASDKGKPFLRKDNADANT